MDQLSSLDYSIERVSNLLPAMSYLNVNPFGAGNSSLNNFLNLNPESIKEAALEDTLHIKSSQPDFFSTKSYLLSDPTLADSGDKILPTEQSVQQQKFVSPLSSTSVSANDLVNVINSSTTGRISDITSNLDLDYITTLSKRIYAKPGLAPVTSANTVRNNAFGNTFDGTEITKTVSLSSDKLNINSLLQTNTAIEANMGSVEKIPTSLINLY